MNIVIADDDTVCRIILSYNLTKLGHNVDAFSNGADLIKACRMFVYDLIITDISMPDVSGIDAAKEIRKFNTTTPIVASSASEGVSLSEDFNAILPKPIHREDIERLMYYIDIAKV